MTAPPTDLVTGAFGYTGSRIAQRLLDGPETVTFDELVRLARGAVRSRALLAHLPIAVVLGATRLMGLVVRDVVLTRDEIRELMESLLTSAANPGGTAPTRFSDWLAANANDAGRHWSSELARNFAKLQDDKR